MTETKIEATPTSVLLTRKRERLLQEADALEARGSLFVADCRRRMAEEARQMAVRAAAKEEARLKSEGVVN
jgi:hypothetical protein